MTSLTAALRNAAPVAAIAGGMLAVALTACTTTTYTPRQVPVPQVLPSGKQEARILDGRIAADLDSIDALQARIEKLNAGGIPVDDYDLARAQCWLSFGLEEYHQNESHRRHRGRADRVAEHRAGPRDGHAAAADPAAPSRPP